MSRTTSSSAHFTSVLSRRNVTAAAVAASLLTVAACGTSSGGTTASTPAPSASSTGAAMGGMPMGGGGMNMGGGAHQADPGKGLLTTESGYTLTPTTKALTVGRQTISFRILDATGKPVTSYAVDQTKLLHFYLVRNDLTGYVHDHPVLAPDGTWSINVDVAKPGPYRMYTDFVAKDAAGMGHPVVLSLPLTAPGPYTPGPVVAAPATQTVDGLTVAMTGSIAAGSASKVSFQVSAGGKPVTDLEQYLDSFAHMTAIHNGDLAYQHVHPELTASPGQKGGPALPFSVELPEKGTWRLFLQVQRAGVLHLVPFTVTVN